MMTVISAFTPDCQPVPWTPPELFQYAAQSEIVARIDDMQSAETADSSNTLEYYFAIRQQASRLESLPSGEQLVAIQQRVGEWLESDGPLKDSTVFDEGAYSTPDMPAVRDKIEGLADYLRANFGDAVTETELKASDLFLEATEALHAEVPAGGTVHAEADGSFAFIVPARMSRKNTEYGQEVETVLPTFRYVPRHLRAAMMVGLPPFVIDRYKPDQDGKRGYLIFAPVYPDMVDDLSIGGALKIGRKQVNAAIDFAYGRFGTEIAGLGATLPAITGYGKTIDNPNVITTTGHGGTVHLILETIKRAAAEGRVGAEQARKIGVLGLGAIGASIARIVRSDYPDAEMTIFDVREKLTLGVAEEIAAYPAADEREVLEKAGIIISALPDIRLSLAKLGIEPASFDRKLIIDDSQPAAFDPHEIANYGGTLSWVVGHDGDHILRTDYTYGDTLMGASDLFGCEAEAAALAAYYGDLLRSGTTQAEAREQIQAIAIDKAVMPENVRDIGRLFVRYGVSAAHLQAFGKPA